MQAGDIVIHLNMPWTMGLGTILGINEITWLEVEWANGDTGAYPAHHLELADTWERKQVQRGIATQRP